MAAVKPRPRKHLNSLSASEWVRETISVWTQRGLGKNHPDAEIEKQHPAPFSYQDVARIIRFFTKPGETVLDPFVGVGSTLKAAALESRNGIGIELNPRYAELARKRLMLEVQPEDLARTNQTIITGDARIHLSELQEASVSLVVTSPPYWNILHKIDHKARQERLEKQLDHYYSDDPADLGNISDYHDFVRQLGEIFALCKPAMRPKAHLVSVVGDFRHKSRYYMFHSDLAAELEQYGFSLKGLVILYQSQKRVFPYGYPSAYVPNFHHQYIVITQLTNV